LDDEISQLENCNKIIEFSSTEQEVKALTNTEDIKDFYEYTEECLRRISKIERVSDEEILKNHLIQLDDEILKIISKGTKKLAVFDLDETLIHCEVKEYETCQRVFEVEISEGKIAKIGLNVRPYIHEALSEIMQHYILIMYTASQKVYADAVLKIIDPDDKYFVKKLYRNNCIKAKMENENIFIKDLRVFSGVELKNIIIIDNSVLSFCFQMDNGIPILPFYDNTNDQELKVLVNYLKHLKNCESIQEENKKVMNLNAIYQNYISGDECISSADDESHNQILSNNQSQSNNKESYNIIIQNVNFTSNSSCEENINLFNTTYKNCGITNSEMSDYSQKKVSPRSSSNSLYRKKIYDSNNSNFTSSKAEKQYYSNHSRGSVRDKINKCIENFHNSFSNNYSVDSLQLINALK
jgi:Dullard-like phosphatase family protein